MDKYRELRDDVEAGEFLYDADTIRTLLAERDALLEALEEIMADITGGEKSCGHEFTCVCAVDTAREAIEAAKRQEGV